MADSTLVRTREMATTSTAGSQVLEFALGHEIYCVDIEHVTEIVDAGEVTAIPNAPEHVRGVVDLRGRTTAIVDPKTVFGIDGDGRERRIVVFDPNVAEDGAAAGWLVDEVEQVVSIDDDDVDPSPTPDDPSIRGIVAREHGFVIWVDPVAVHSP